MKQYLAGIIILASFAATGQNFTTCKVYQYQGNDSLNKQLVSEKTYNSKGKLTSDWYKGYREDLIENFENKHEKYFYEDTLLTKIVSGDDNGDSTYIYFFYNEKGQKTQEVHHTYQSHPDATNARHNNGLVITMEDDTRNKSRKITKRISYFYDERGNTVMRKDEDLQFHWRTNDSLVYDSKNRLVELSSYNGNKLEKKMKYTYSKKAYSYIYISYKENGDSDTLYKVTKRLNGNGKITDEKVEAKVSYWESSTNMKYNKKGNLIRETIFDRKGNPEITHIYVYE